MRQKIKSNLAEINCYSQDTASAFQWFREIHNLYPVVRKRNDMYGKYFYRIVNWNNGNIIFESEPSYSFIEAKNLVLEKLIEIVKNE